MPDSTTVEDCYAIAAKYALLEQLPGRWVNSFVVTRWRRRRSRMIRPFIGRDGGRYCSNKTAAEEAGVMAAKLGFAVEMDNSCDDWDYEPAASTCSAVSTSYGKKCHGCA